MFETVSLQYSPLVLLYRKCVDWNNIGGELSREYWMVYRGPGFLAVIWVGSSPTPPPSPVSKLERRRTGRLRKRAKLPTEEGGKRAGEEPNRRRPRESLVLYKSVNTLCLPVYLLVIFLTNAFCQDSWKVPKEINVKITQTDGWMWWKAKQI